MQIVNDPLIAPLSDEGFGLTAKDIKNYRIKNFFNILKYYFAKIAPAGSKIINSVFYYFIKFIKYFFTSMLRMIMGKEI